MKKSKNIASKKSMLVADRPSTSKKVTVRPSKTFVKNDPVIEKKKSIISNATESSAKMYWNSDTESSIIEYVKSSDSKKKNMLYEVSIRPALEKMVENVINTFKFEYFETDKITARQECLGHIMANIHKYDPTNFKGKSFGYFSTSAKNFFILLNNSNHKRWKNHELLEYHPKNDLDQITERHIPVDDHIKSQSKTKSEFIELMIKFWDKNINKVFTKEVDRKIANSVLDIFKLKEIDVYNKKYIYFCIKEMCNCKTQQLTKVINKMKKYQTTIHKSYIDFGELE